MDIREAYLKYFESKMHQRVASAPLVPEDATLLFNNAGMVPFKSIFTGEIPTPSNPRATSVQTCIRAGGKHNDLENVGYTARHHTFFEMLGNFSFGDYFKEEVIAFSWEFITEVLELPIDKLHVTVHDSDDEAEQIWKKYVAPERIMRLGDKDNFWQMGDTGPCGPCSEIFYDQGAEEFSGEEDYMGGEGDRFLEIWNLVFMQYERSKDGTLTPLPKPSIDTGMGLERVVAIKEGVTSNYSSSLFMPIIERVSELIGKPYEYKSGSSFRVIADHIRTCSFLLAQGVTFSNEGRGYVNRRILRRAIRHGYLLGFKEPFMHKIVDVLVQTMSGAYPYLTQQRESIKETIFQEESNFFKTIAQGIAMFNDELSRTTKLFSGEVAFKLYDTSGFPLDLTQDMLREKNIELDIEKFQELMREQRERSKASWKGSGDAANEGDFKALLESFGENEFVGYENSACSANIQALLAKDFSRVDSLHKTHEGWVLLNKTPFYAQGGGQAGESGTIVIDGNVVAEVLDTKKIHGLNLSHIRAKDTLHVEAVVEAVVDVNRIESAKHHSATHLLHSALYELLGAHISQAGSLVEPTRLRFDFSHNKALSHDELMQIEQRVNYNILHALPRDTKLMNIDEAKKSGAKAQFGEKYSDDVRVVGFGTASVELCGGIHVENTSSIGTFIITKESGVSAGVRRIEAVCGNAAYNFTKALRHRVDEACDSLKNRDLLSGISRLQEQVKTLKAEVQEAQQSSKESLEAVEVKGVAVVIEEISAGDVKDRIDEIKNSYDSVAAMLFQVKGDKVIIAAGVKNAGLKAGDWIKKIAPICGGGGGGRPDFAQAGGKDITKIEEAKSASLEFVKEVL
ncbi:MAG: alanine--tRNA ligase [Campylobacterota bacterium]|nr:alanine--tRNA ligase [Campylobacterota bacterium]